LTNYLKKWFFGNRVADEKVSKVLISQNRLKNKVKELAQTISGDYQGKELVVIGVLKGCFVFMADLLRELTIPVEIDFVQISSYGGSKTPSEKLEIKKNIDMPVEGKDVLLVDEIVDYGYTLKSLLKMVKSRNAKSVKICAMLDKPSRRKVPLSIDYKGFEIPDKFVVGYGLDFDEKYRYLPYVAELQ
jgi:hypoxanthine phosphoribosyltransferase